MMFSLDMLDCPVYSLSLSTWIFYAGWVEGIILSQFYSLGFVWDPSFMLTSFGRVVVVVAYMILVSSSALPHVRVGPGLNNKYILCRCNMQPSFEF